jgi:hypothetical protein
MNVCHVVTYNMNDILYTFRGDLSFLRPSFMTALFLRFTSMQKLSHYRSIVL